MLHGSMLKVTKFQVPPPKRFGRVIKNILGGHHASPPCQIGLNQSFTNISSLPKNTPQISLILHQCNLYVLLICGKEIGDD